MYSLRSGLVTFCGKKLLAFQRQWAGEILKLKMISPKDRKESFAQENTEIATAPTLNPVASASQWRVKKGECLQKKG